MTRLRQRMLEDMQLRGLSARTQGAYVLAVCQLAEHFHRRPDQITEEELRQYCLVADPRYVGARVGCLAVLHTWTPAMLYHPHVHLLVTAGDLSADGTQWIAPKNPAFLVPVQALSVIFRAKVCAGLRRAGLLDHVTSSTWTTPWVVHAQHAGRGQRSSTISVGMCSASRSPTVDWTKSPLTT